LDDGVVCYLKSSTTLHRSFSGAGGLPQHHHETGFQCSSLDCGPPWLRAGIIGRTEFSQAGYNVAY